MTVADAAMPPAASALRLVALAAAGALIYPWFAIVWVGCTVSVAMVITRGALGEGSPVLSAVSYAGVFFAFLSPVAFILIGVHVHVLGTGSKFNSINARKVMGPHVDGSQREWIGSVLMDLGILGTSAISCFIILPFMIMMVRRMKQGGDAVVLRSEVPADPFSLVQLQ